ncbi:galectin 4, partial [Chelydra serpentina]
KNEAALHFKTLFREDRDTTVFNSFLNKEWGQEEQRCFSPFQKGRSFQLQFVITKKGYKVTVDNKPFYEYSHRIPLEQVKILQVVGAVELKKIEIFKDSSTSRSASPESK